MKDANEMATFMGLSINAGFASAEKGKNFVQRIGEFVPAIMSADPAFEGSSLIGAQVNAAATYEEFNEPAKAAYDALEDVKGPKRAIIAQQIGVLVLTSGVTGIFDSKDEEEEQ